MEGKLQHWFKLKILHTKTKNMQRAHWLHTFVYDSEIMLIT